MNNNDQTPDPRFLLLRELVEKHGNTIELRLMGENHGSRVVVSKNDPNLRMKLEMLAAMMDEHSQLEITRSPSAILHQVKALRESLREYEDLAKNVEKTDTLHFSNKILESRITKTLAYFVPRRQREALFASLYEDIAECRQAGWPEYRIAILVLSHLLPRDVIPWIWRGLGFAYVFEHIRKFVG